MATWRHEAIARPYWRLYWNPDPGWSVTRAGHTIDLGPTRVLLVAPETIYTTAWRRPSRHVYLHFTCDGLPGIPVPAIHEFSADATWRGLLALARGGDHLHASALAMHALACLPTTAYGSVVTSGATLAAQQLGLRYLHRLVDNRELARAAGLQVNAFIRRFRSDIGTTPRHWHLRQRIEAACLALEEGATIDDAAEKFGFCDRHHFTRVFTRVRGIAPAAYRASATRTVDSSSSGRATRTAKTR
jgi:AraC-like DNA-binding protein